MLYLSGIIITFFLAVVLGSKKAKTAADRVLTVWLCVIGVHLLFYYWHITGEIYNHTYLLALQLPVPLLHGPLLYLYTVLLARGKGFSKKPVLHFIPAAVAYAMLSKYYGLPAAEKIWIYKNSGAGFEIQTQLIFIATVLSGFMYVLLSFYELKKYRKRIANEFSNTEKINLNWLRYLIYGILTIWVVILLNGNDAMIFGAAAVFVFLLGYFGIKQIGVFTYRPAVVREITNATREPRLAVVLTKSIEKVTEVAHERWAAPVAMTPEVLMEKGPVLFEQAPTRTRYQKSALQKETAAKIHHDLNQLVHAKKIFKQEELSLAQLAQQLDVHPNNLSQVINTYENKSFYDYINTLRIEEFKTLAHRPENSRYTLLSLAFECGFNSKTSFNRNFKKITGQSPSAYLKAANLQLVDA